MDGLDDLMHDGPAALTYVDPPWGQRLVSGFETLADRQAGRERPGNRIEPLMDRLFELIARHTVGYAVVEYGTQERERAEGQAIDLRALAARHRLTYLGRWEEELTPGGTDAAT